MDAVGEAQVQDGAGPEGVDFYACVREVEEAEEDGEDGKVDMHGWCSSGNGFLAKNDQYKFLIGLRL